MKIVLVMLNNMQEYVLDNIENLKNHNNKDITIITDNKFNNYFEDKDVQIINIEEILPCYTEHVSKIANSFRNGFWNLTSYRFKAIHEYMRLYNIENIIHIENDVLIYKDMELIKFHNTNKILLTMDSKKRCIPGIMFIPNYSILHKCVNNFNSKLNDMENWAECYYKFNNEIDTLPIFINEKDTTDPVLNLITKNFHSYNLIFDAAAIGQFLGGIDPRNNSGNTIGFVNETCVIDYSKYKFVWTNENRLKTPYIIIKENEYPIINLHIHSKNLKNFI
jgi:hypothetical protein